MANSEVTYIYDALNKFRAPGLAPLAADGTVGALALDKLVDVRPSSQRNKLGAKHYKIVIVVESVVTAGGETYTFNADVGATGAANTRVGSINVSAPGQHVLILDADTIEKQNAAREELALKLDVTGAGASIKFSAWLV